MCYNIYSLYTPPPPHCWTCNTVTVALNLGISPLNILSVVHIELIKLISVKTITPTEYLIIPAPEYSYSAPYLFQVVIAYFQH